MLSQLLPDPPPPRPLLLHSNGSKTVHTDIYPQNRIYAIRKVDYTVFFLGSPFTFTW